MGDMGEVFREMQQATKERHQRWKEQNTRALITAGLQFRSTNNGETLILREPGRPKVDFYPSTGRWKIIGEPGPPRAPRKGGAESFLVWYAVNRA